MKKCMETDNHTPAQTGFIRILRDYIHRVRDIYTVDDTLLHYAKIHQLEGIVYFQTDIDGLSKAYRYSIYAYRNRINLVNEISRALKDIPHFFVKGLVIAYYYPDPAIRSMGDCDLTVKIEDKEKVAVLLESAGFRFIKKGGEAEWLFQKNGFVFELHHALLYGEEAGETENDDFLDYFSNCWFYYDETRHELTPEFHFLYVLIHLRKHFMNKGIGIRQFLDIALLSRQSFDWPWIENQLELLKLTDFAKTVIGLNEIWFDVTSPFSFSGEVKNKEEALDMILNAGVFGFESDDEEKHLANLTMRYGKQHNGLSYIRFLFPSYDYFLKSRKYSDIIKGRPYLLPVIWIYRAFTMHHELDTVKKRFFIKEEDVQKRKEVYKDWGLM